MTAASGEACVHSEPLLCGLRPDLGLWLVILGLIIIILTCGDLGLNAAWRPRLLPRGNVG